MKAARIAQLEVDVRALQSTLTRIHTRAASAEKSRSLRLANLGRSMAAAKTKQRAKAKR